MKTDKCQLLKNSKTIAVVGISHNPNRISREIANYLVYSGFEVVGVNPNEAFKEAEGIIIYNSLLDIPHHIDIVNVFRKSEDIPLIIDDVIAIKPNSLWLQLGIRNDNAVAKVIEKGIKVVQDSCIMVDNNYCV